ncbi:chlorophyll synthetase [Aureococcus anophagefferens]|nr:chlorophyll synthetase [Aureococcus anophagefferens]
MRALLFALLLAARLRAAACFGYESIYARIIEEQVLVKFTEHVTMAGTMMTAFSTGWLYNGTVVLDDVRALVYTQALAASDDVYFVWTGHPSGAFVGYYNKGFLAAANGSRALGRRLHGDPPRLARRRVRLAFADVDPASVLAYIREASSGYVVVASVPNATQLHAPSTTLNSASEVLFYEALSHPNDLIRTSAAHLEATGSWNRTGGPFDHAGLYYDVAAITDNGLDWNLVTLQRQSCPEGYYTSLAPGDYGSCQARLRGLPATGFVCDAVTVTLETLPLDAGYMRLHDESTEALACLGGKTACPGEAGRVGCDGGHFEAFSPYCSVCEPGYYLDATRCAPCGRGLGVRAGVGFALAAVVVLLVARYLATAGSSRAQSAKLVRRERLYNKLKSKWRIVFVSFQIVYSLPNLLNGVRFPRLMRVQFEALHVLTLDGVKVATATATVVVTYFVLPSVTLKILQIFDCEVLDDAGGKQAFLFADYSVRCGGFDYFVYTIYAILAVFVWPVGVPLLYFTLLHRHKHEINPSVVVAAPSDAGSARARSLEIRSANGNIRHLGLLYTPYEPHMWWWEIAEIARRLLSTSFLLVVSRGAVGRLFFGIMISLASTKLLAVFEPYISDSDDNLAEMLQWLVTVNLLASLGIVVGHGSAALAVASMSLQVVALGAAFVLIKNDITRERKVFEEAMEELRKDIDEYKSALEATAGDYVGWPRASASALLREAPRAPPTDEADAAAVERRRPGAARAASTSTWTGAADTGCSRSAAQHCARVEDHASPSCSTQLLMMMRSAIMRSALCLAVASALVQPRGPGVRPLKNAGAARPLKTRRVDAPPTIVSAKGDLEGDAKVGSSGFRQLVGFRGAADTEDEPLWKIRVQLTKPGTWVPLIWGVACGAAASGNYRWPLLGGASLAEGGEDLAKALTCMVLSGPCLTGFCQTINDWYDRDLDAINEPYRPIPSGRITEEEVFQQVYALLFGGLALAFGCDAWAGHDVLGNPLNSIGLIACFGAVVSYLYSAPPFKLKAEGWRGSFALGASYIALPWWCGQAMFGEVGAGAAGGELTPDVVVLTVLYSFAGLGIAIVNDFKSIEGDRELGLKSLPVAFGIDGAKYICAGMIDVTQISVAAYLAYIGETTYALILGGLIAPQIWAQTQYLLKDPVKYDVKYQGTAQPFLVFGILTTALAVSHHGGALAGLA